MNWIAPHAPKVGSLDLSAQSGLVETAPAAEHFRVSPARAAMRFLFFITAAILVAIVAAWALASLRRRSAPIDLTIEPSPARRSLLEPVPLVVGAATAAGAMLLLAALGLVDDVVAVMAACLLGLFAAAAAAFWPTREDAGSEERRVASRWSAAADVMDRIAARASKEDRDLFRSMARALRGVARRARNPRQACRLARFSRVALPRIVTLSGTFVETSRRQHGDLDRRRANLTTCARALEKIERDCAEREIDELDVDLDVLASQIERLAA